jgi:hypothetical protein
MTTKADLEQQNLIIYGGMSELWEYVVQPKELFTPSSNFLSNWSIIVDIDKIIQFFF